MRSGIAYTPDVLRYLDEHGSLLGYDPERVESIVAPACNVVVIQDREARSKCLECHRDFGGIRAIHGRSCCSARCANRRRARL